MWWLLTVFPPICILGGLAMLAEAVVFTTGAESARGEVVHISRHYNIENGVSYTPTIRYRRDDSRIFEADTNMASSSYDYGIGERVDILYSYADPTEVRINSIFSLNGPWLMFLIVGAVLIRIVTWARRKDSHGTLRQRVFDAIAERLRLAVLEQERDTKTERTPWPGTTDPSKPGHIHKPKPKRTPAVRRMR